MVPSSLYLVLLLSALDDQGRAAVDAHSQTVQLIRTIQIEYKIVELDKPNDPSCDVSWSRDGQTERIGRTCNQDGLKSAVDYVLLGDTLKVLENWYPQTPLTPTHQNRVGASMAPRTPFAYAGLSPAFQLHFEVDSGPRRTLSELAKVSPHCDCKGKVEIDGRSLWLIDLDTPEEATSTTPKKRMEVFLDPSVGYSIRRLVLHLELATSNNSRQTYEWVYEVVDYRDFGDGVFLPIRIKNGPRRDGIDLWSTEFIVTSLKVNEPVPPETFEMNWPKYVLLKHFPAINGEIRFDIWGDGQPLRELKGNVDLQEVEEELRANPKIAAELDANLAKMEAVPAASSWLMAVNLAVVCGAVLLILVFAIRRHRRAGGA